MKNVYLIVELSRKRIWSKKYVLLVKEAIIKTIQCMISYRSINQKLLNISVFLTNNNEIQKINHTYRNINKVTNVLSFQNIDWQNSVFNEIYCEQIDFNRNTKVYDISHNDPLIIKLNKLNTKELVLSFGDIIISYEKVFAEAVEQSRCFDEYLQFITVHGVLHLLGYDHGNEKDAQNMEAFERKIMQKLKNEK